MKIQIWVNRLGRAGAGAAVYSFIEAFRLIPQVLYRQKSFDHHGSPWHEVNEGLRKAL